MPQYGVRAANVAWMLGSLPAAVKFRRALLRPALVQREILKRYLRENEETEYGRRYHFGQIRTVAEYQQRVPLSTYEDYKPYIAKIAAGGRNVLTREPVRYFAVSSGSASAEKWIPYTRGLLAEFSRAIAPWVSSLFGASPDLLKGPAYWCVTPQGMRAAAGESRIPVGFDQDSAYVGGFFGRLVEATFAVPESLRHVQDMESFRYLTLLCLLRARALRLISVWHPSFLGLLLKSAGAHWERLLGDIRLGLCRPPGDVAAPVLHALKRTQQPRPGRAAELQSIGPCDYSRFWPDLGLISCWADAHARPPAEELAAQFPRVTLQGKGLISTEAFVSLPLPGTQGCPFAIRSHFFELITDAGEIIPATDGEAGGIYSVAVTTAGGLYRYNTHDRVRITGRCGQTPCIEFLGKEDQISDRFGEKLNAQFVADVLRQLQQQWHMLLRFGMLAPDGRGYTLFLEAGQIPPPGAAHALDRMLCGNPHYAHCRALGQLTGARVFMVEGDAAAIFLETCRRKGMRLGNIKPTALNKDTGWGEIFGGRYVAPEIDGVEHACSATQAVDGRCPS